MEGSGSSEPSAGSSASAKLDSASSGLEGGASSCWGCVASGTEACGQETLTLHEHCSNQGRGASSTEMTCQAPLYGVPGLHHLGTADADTDAAQAWISGVLVAP